ncbi:MAG: disulfide bond formation protein B [Methylovirgula sp.]|uniref:disulfide bond formation protein B n=1 Tax=Methylovirgula sp. TaxID=1978224 RepID=UPI003075F7AA
MAETYFRDVHASRAAGLILLIAAATIAGAWIFQAFGIAPCELCLSERIPYYVGVPVAALTLIFALRESKALMLLGFIALFLIFAFSAGFGVYHAGVEWHFWDGPTACTGSTMTKAATMQDFMNQLRTVKVVRCDAVAIRILGLSLAGWNAVISAVLAVIAVWGARKVG